MEAQKEVDRPDTARSDSAEADERIAVLQREVQALRGQLADRPDAQPTADGDSASCELDALPLTDVVDSVDTLVIVLDDQGRILLFNRACQQIYGYKPEQVIGQQVWELFRPLGFADIAKQAFNDLRTTGTSPDLERYAIERDGQLHFIQWSSRPLKRPNQSECVVITGVNVTRRREAERALQRQVRFEQLVAQLSRRFVSLTADKLDVELQAAMHSVAQSAKVDGCSLWLLEDASDRASLRAAWPANTGTGDTAVSITTERLASIVGSIRAGESLRLDTIESPQRDALGFLQRPGQDPIAAYLAMPLTFAGRSIGWLALESRTPRTWPGGLQSLVRIIAELIANAIERIRSEESLRASEARFRKIFEGMPVMLWATEAPPDFTVDPPRITFLAWNAECERVSGYRADEVVGNPRVYELLAPDEDYYRRLTQELGVLGNDFRDSHWLMRTRSGDLRMIAWSNLSGRLPIPGWPEWGIGIDVTDQYEAQQELIRAHHELEVRVEDRTKELSAANTRLLREIENREVVQGALLHQTRILRAILNSIFDGVAVADRQGKFILFNKAAERILQAGAVEAGPDDWPSIYGLLLPDQETPYAPRDLPLVRATRGETVESAEIYLKRKDGPTGVWLSVNACPLADHAGELQGGVAIFRDITETKLAHQELKTEQQSLQQLLRAHERDRQLLAYEIHDGLVQDVTGAAMHLESFAGRRNDNPEKAEQELQLCLHLMRRTIDEARRLISGLRPPILDEQGIAAAIEYLIGEHGMRGPMEIDFHHDVGAKHYDSLLEGTIYRIVQEALNNVHRHSQATHVEVALIERENVIQLQVLDNGVGFDTAQVVEHRYGLEGIRERARLLRGSARIESAPGQGTRVYVELPAMQRNVREGNQNEYPGIDR